MITFFAFSIFNSFLIENYILYFGLYELIIFIISIANYLSLYGTRVLIPKFIKNKKESEILEKIRVHESTYEKSDNISMNFSQITSTASKESEKTGLSMHSNSIFAKVLEYHYIKENA